MSDLLKTTRASEIFSITGLPDVDVRQARRRRTDGQSLYEVELRGLDIFNPRSMEHESIERRERALLDARHRLRRHELLRHAGVLPEDQRLGQPAEVAEGDVRRLRLGRTSPGR